MFNHISKHLKVPQKYSQYSMAGHMSSSLFMFGNVANTVSFVWYIIWTTSTRLSASTIFEFQTSDVSRALALHVGFR